MRSADRVLKTMILTEKASDLSANLNKYTFRVATDADKGAVAEAVAHTYGVAVERVNLISVPSKSKRNRMVRGASGTKSGYKKAIITLKEGEKIETL